MNETTERAVKAAVQDLAQRIYAASGGITTTALVDAARDPHEPAHAGFEWDDAKAGEEYRKHQARKWLGVITIQITPSSEPERLIHVPRIVRADDPGREGEYKAVSYVVRRPSELRRALQQLASQVMAQQRTIDSIRQAVNDNGTTRTRALFAELDESWTGFQAAARQLEAATSSQEDARDH